MGRERRPPAGDAGRRRVAGDRRLGKGRKPARTAPRSSGATALAVGGDSLWIDRGGAVERWHLHPLRREQTYPLELLDYGGRGITFGYGAAWSTLGSETNTLLRIDALSGQATRIPVGKYPDGRPAIGFGSVWVAMYDDNTVWRIDPDTGTPQRIIPVGHGPWSAAVGSGSVWITNQCDGTVSRIDPDTNTVVKTIETGYNPRWLAAGSDSVWVGVTEIDGPSFNEECV